MSEHWCHWYVLSPPEWENCDNENGDNWTIQLIEDSLKKQPIHLDMMLYEKRMCFTNII